MVTRAAVSRRVQPGTCMIYHAPERTIYDAEVAGTRRRSAAAATTASPAPASTRVQLAGGYAQFTYGFNYWGPTGVFTRDTHAVVPRWKGWNGDGDATPSLI